jgi:hypothetical protein
MMISMRAMVMLIAIRHPTATPGASSFSQAVARPPPRTGWAAWSFLAGSGLIAVACALVARDSPGGATPVACWTPLLVAAVWPAAGLPAVARAGMLGGVPRPDLILPPAN